MLKLNLIPPYILEARRVKKLLVLCLLFLVVVIAACLGWFVILGGRLSRLEADFTELDGQAARVRSTVSEKTAVEQGIQPLKTKLQFMRDLEAFNEQWADLVEKLNEYIPRRVQVQSLQLTPTAIQLQGMTFNTTEDVDLIDRNFKRCPLLNPLSVNYQPSGAAGGGPGGFMQARAAGGQQPQGDLISFTVTAQLAQPLVVPSLGGGGAAQGGAAGFPGSGGMSIPGGMSMPGMPGSAGGGLGPGASTAMMGGMPGGAPAGVSAGPPAGVSAAPGMSGPPAGR